MIDNNNNNNNKFFNKLNQAIYEINNGKESNQEWLDF